MGDPLGYRRLSKSNILHLVATALLLLAPIILGISLAATEHSAPDRIIPWSSATVGWGALKGEFSFGLRQFALCNPNNPDQCTRLYYEDQQLILGDDAVSLQKNGKTIYVMVILATCLLALSFIFSLSLLLCHGRDTFFNRVPKYLNTVFGFSATALFLISAIIWGSSLQSRLSDHSSDVHLTWGFALALVSFFFGLAASLVECLRPVSYDEAL